VSERVVKVKMKKFKLILGAGVVAYEVYDRIKRNNEKRALSAAQVEIEYLEQELAAVKRNLHENTERRRKFTR